GHVGLDAEQRVGQADAAALAAGRGLDLHRSHRAPPPFTASRMRTSPPLGPGTAPRTSSSWLSGSACPPRRFWVVTFWLPMRPAMRVPLNTRAGVAHAPTEP